MAHLILVLATFVVSFTTRRALAMDEPSCMSKFDYDYKMLQKIIDLEQRQKDLQAALDEQKIIVKELSQETTNHGSTFTIWGKKTCPGNETTLVYSGFMAGSHHKHTGSGSNYLCLSAKPLWDYYDEKTDSSSRIYGVEYQFSVQRYTGSRNFFGQHVFSKNAPCAVCHIPRGTSIMIPGRNECFTGWKKEYSGYLVSAAYTHQATEYVCLSGDLDFVDGNESDDDESILYFVEGMCDKSLPCPPYVKGRELTCVVCSL